MFYSTGNNFGAGAIRFKDVQEKDYVVLNAVFSYDTENADYLAADVLEISVPSLSIGRSTVSAVAVTFRDRPFFTALRAIMTVVLLRRAGSRTRILFVSKSLRLWRVRVKLPCIFKLCMRSLPVRPMRSRV